MRDCTRLMQDISGNFRVKISIGLTSGRANIMMRGLIAEFHKAYPHVSLSFRITNSDELRELLYMGKIDIAVIASLELTDDFHYEALGSEEVVLVCSDKHKLAHFSGFNEDESRKQCDIHWFADAVFGIEALGTPMRTQSERIFAEYRFEPDTVIENCTTALLMQLASEGICCTIFSERHLKLYDNVVGFSFNPRKFFNFSLAYRKDYIPNVAEEHLLDLLRKFFKN